MSWFSDGGSSYLHLRNFGSSYLPQQIIPPNAAGKLNHFYSFYLNASNIFRHRLQANLSSQYKSKLMAAFNAILVMITPLCKKMLDIIIYVVLSSTPLSLPY